MKATESLCPTCGHHEAYLDAMRGTSRIDDEGDSLHLRCARCNDLFTVSEGDYGWPRLRIFLVDPPRYTKED